MSLINKMLKDLESRQALENRSDRPLFSDLHAAGARPRQLPWRTMLLGVATLAVVAFFAWDRFLSVPPAPVAVQPRPLTPLAPVAESVPPATVTAEVPVPKPAPVKPAVTPKPAPVHAPAKAVTAEPKPAPKTNNESGPARIEKTERPYTSQEIAERSIRDAERLRAQGNPAEAERQLEALLAKQPSESRARELLATLQAGNGRWPRAQATLEEGIQLEPARLSYRTQLARQQLERNELPAAITTLEAARTVAPNDAELLAFLAALQQRANRHADAVRVYRDALAIKPGEGKWWIGLGISLESEKQGSEAANAYRQALNGGPLPAALSAFASDRLKALAPAR